MRNTVSYADATALNYATPVQDNATTQESDRRQPQAIPWQQPLAALPANPTPLSVRGVLSSELVGQVHDAGLQPLAPAVTIDGPRDLPSHEEQTEDGQSEASQQQALDIPAGAQDTRNGPEASDHLSPVTEGMQQAYERAPMLLPSLMDCDRGTPRPDSNIENAALPTGTSEETQRAADPTATTESPQDPSAGLITVQVHPDIVVPEVVMTRLARPPFPFKPIVAVLERERLRGSTRVMFSQLGSLVRQEDARAYAKAGITQLKDYVARAEQAGVVIVGHCAGPHGQNGNKWTALHPTYHGRSPEVVAAAQPTSAPAPGTMPALYPVA